MRVRYLFSSRRTGRILGINDHRKPVPKIVKEVIDISDIVLEVVDARFIEKTRNKELEQYILSLGKNIIYVVNKVDLVDYKDLKEQLKGLYPYVAISCAKRQGLGKLRERIKIEVSRIKARLGKEAYKRAQVGIIGYPNTGKSSLINILIGKRGVASSPQAGLTRGMTKLRLSKDIQIIDTPGIIPDKESNVENNTIKKANLEKQAEIGVQTFDKIKEPEMAISYLMKSNPGYFEKKYDIDADGDSELLIEEYGRRKNLLLKGNKVNVDLAARMILKEWQRMK